MRRMLACLLLAGCAAPAAPRIVYVPVEAAPPAPPVMPAPAEMSARNVTAVVRREHRLVAEAGRYVVWPQSKPAIIDRLGTLTATAQASIAQLRAARTLGDRAAALPAAEAAVNALSNYLKTKGD